MGRILRPNFSRALFSNGNLVFANSIPVRIQMFCELIGVVSITVWATGQYPVYSEIKDPDG